jgi:RimJ/RimL family protein N-acetyltransferase
MTKPIEIRAADRDILMPLFKNCQYDRVIIDSVLEGNFGTAYADSASQPIVARLDSGEFTMLGGNPLADGVKDLLHRAPIYYVTPQDNEWRILLQREFDTRISSALPFTDFSCNSLNLAHLAKLTRAIPSAFDLMKIDKPLAERLPSDVGNEHFFETFQSVDDFLERGIGFCIFYQEKIVSAATSMAKSSKAIDIEIETVSDFRKQGLGTAVGAKLVSYCLEHKIEPRWLAANDISVKLALKLGYVRGETYETLRIQ